MKIRDIMSQDVEFCLPGTPLQEVAQQMIDRDCGAIPVVSDSEARQVLGVVTDRDITIRMVAQGLDPTVHTARDCMSTPVVTLDIDATVAEAQQVLERHQVRRIPIIDSSNGVCCGMITQADIARYAPSSDTAAMVKRLSLRVPQTARLEQSASSHAEDGEPLWGS
jgi:CBS domain-containing protein